MEKLTLKQLEEILNESYFNDLEKQILTTIHQIEVYLPFDYSDDVIINMYKCLYSVEDIKKALNNIKEFYLIITPVKITYNKKEITYNKIEINQEAINYLKIWLNKNKLIKISLNF